MNKPNAISVLTQLRFGIACIGWSVGFFRIIFLPVWYFNRLHLLNKKTALSGFFVGFSRA
jgi:hypothetical protein